ncbi:MAG: cysteine--tRNA ligase [Kiloniellaceae bacterium]
MTHADLQFHNTLTRRKERFEPIDPANVRLYVCGPTVYDFAHIGNARPVVAFDVLFRLLRHVYGDDHVTYARNITDVDDKIIQAAKETGEPIESITARTAQAYHDDMDALGALRPSIEPRATQHIGRMIAMTEALIEKGHAYAAEGHVLFSVTSKADYGELSRLDRDALLAGARVAVAPYKKDPADFVLWKPSTTEQPGWDSPWGRGRPGWHIECSAMAEEHLGDVFDIHGGGLDLVFPHHENEIAQSRCAHGTQQMARVWMHNGYVVVNGEKMSKSLGNFFTVRQLLEEGLRGEAIRLALLSGHYRAPLDITREKIAESKGQLDRLYGALRGLAVDENAEPPAAVLAALADDLNTPLAIAELHELATEMNKAKDEDQRETLAGELLAGATLLGLLQDDPDAWFKGEAAEGGLSAEDIEAMIAARIEARKAKDFAEAARLRDALLARGITLEDGPGGTTWRRAD